MPEFPAADRSLPITCGRHSKVHRLSVHPDRPLVARRPCHRGPMPTPRLCRHGRRARCPCADQGGLGAGLLAAVIGI